MKKLLLIPVLLIAAAISASAHCGTCGTGEAHDKAAVKQACPTDCAKPCCTKDAKCDKSEAKCDKSEAKCDKSEAKCDKSEAKCTKDATGDTEKKACCPKS